MKRVTVAIVGIFLLAWTHPAGAQFPDVPPGTAYDDAISFGVLAGWLQGYPDGKFRPSAAVNRAEFLKILIEANDIRRDPFPCVGWKLFHDVSPSDWFSPYVCAAVQKGFVTGYPDGTFRPSQPITFVEAAKIVTLTSEIPPGADDGLWYEPYVEALALRRAVPPSVDSLSHRMSRGEMAEIVYRLQADLIDRPSTDVRQFLNQMPSAMPQYVSKRVAPGDPVGGMHVSRVGFDRTVFRGDIRVRGRYTDYRDDYAEQRDGICMHDFDALTLSILPVNESGAQLFCFTPGENDLSTFPMGSLGRAEVTIRKLTRYTVGGSVSDTAELRTVVFVNHDPETELDCAERGGTWDAGMERRRRMTILGDTEIIRGACNFLPR